MTARESIAAGASADHVCVPLQGSGTFAVEAALGTLVPRNGKVLVPDNGAKLTTVDTFRVGCIGAIAPHHLRQAVSAIGAVLRDMGVRRFA